jgi:glycosyltransferase involved in cell wall biosynthesis
MHLLLIHQAFASPGEAGGTRHYELARHMVQKKQGVTIVASDLSYLSGKRITGARRMVTAENLDGVRILRAYTYPLLHRSVIGRAVSFLSFMLSSVWAAWKAGPVDLVMGTSPPIFQGVSAWMVAVLRRRPFLLEIRDLWPEFLIGVGGLKNPALIFVFRLLERFLYARADHILVNSPAYRAYLLGKGVPAAKISLIANGVDPGMFDPDARGEEVRRAWGLEGRFVATYAGALGMANDIPTILRAAQQLRDQDRVRVVLVGGGKERPALEAMARNLGLTNVLFTGTRPKTEMREILAASNICIATLKNIPAFSMPYPNKVFDYMAAGRPTVLAIDGAIRRVIEAAGGGMFVPPGNEEALAAAVRALSRDPGRAEAMGRAARAYVCRNFNRRQQAEEFAGLIQALGRGGKN